MTTLVGQLSSYAAALRYEELPREVVHQAKRLIIDTMGCALGGPSLTPPVIAATLRIPDFARSGNEDHGDP